jgi:hypothetical protein
MLEQFLATTEMKDARLAVCASCPSKHPEFDLCTTCGCVTFMKARLTEQHCPEGKWENGSKSEI